MAQREQLDLFAWNEAQEEAPLTLVAFDLETTGLKPTTADIIEVAGIKFTLEGEEVGTFQQFANPGYRVPVEITEITGITTETLAEARPPFEVVCEFMIWAGGDPVLVAHNAPFDAAFLMACFRNGKTRPPRCGIVDTLEWARERFPRLANHKLTTLLKHIRADVRGLHRGLADAQGVMALTRHLARLSRDPKDAVLRRVIGLGATARRRRR